MRYRKLCLVPAAIVLAGSVHATTYLSIEEAQQILFPGQQLEPLTVNLTPEQIKAIEKEGKVRVRSSKLQVFKATSGGYFFVDEVLGKHEFITYALALDARGAIIGVEVLEYRETYGDEIRNDAWRRQYHGLTAATAPELGKSIRNISGATLSCRHLTDGIRRLLLSFDVALH